MNFEGKWKNELGSKMELKKHSDGSVTGLYLSSMAGNDQQTEPLAGMSREAKLGIFIGWTVCFSSTEEPTDDPTVCSWSGNYTSQNGVETIDTTWLLTQSTDETGEWDNTLVGKNLFTRE